ncbi:hypothetical protein LHK_02012 [Laribacter hongkongensis HLHK9]|uniref:Uncharacterized protein n=1 Tax=Laribacter hongkongensis (strain HLHK9) TaxID=557598 RepID=C1D956_LARHH|nr:hypothetical protein [Laribacter hongkongensis]ACO74996.1 hypothetical protein LHK_02012 [Laribacter hongkongensis HLHK9]
MNPRKTRHRTTNWPEHNRSPRIGSNLYYYRDPINHYVVDRWWGKIDCARAIMDFEFQIKVKMDFSNVWPSL